MAGPRAGAGACTAARPERRPPQARAARGRRPDADARASPVPSYGSNTTNWISVPPGTSPPAAVSA